MKNNREATHTHKRQGAVAILESTSELARIVVVVSGEEFWVKQVDLTPLASGVNEENKVGKKRAKAAHPKAAVRAA